MEYAYTYTGTVRYESLTERERAYTCGDVVPAERRPGSGRAGSDAQESVRPSLQVAAHRRQRCGQDVRAFPLRRRHVQHDVHLHHW